MKNDIHTIKILLLVFAVFFSALGWSQSTIPKRLTLKYDFELASIPLGELEKRLTFQDGVYKADSTIEANAAARLLFSGEVTEVSTFKVKNNVLIPLSFHAIRKNYKPYDRKATFDHHNKRVNYNTGKDEPLRESTYDLGSFPFAFMLEDLTKIENKIYNINTGNKYRDYVALKPSTQTINTPAGEFSTTKITLKRKDSNNRFYHVWLDNRSQYPVKIVRDKKGKISSLILTSVAS